MTQEINDQTPIAMLTVGQLKEVLGVNSSKEEIQSRTEQAHDGVHHEKYVYGLDGLRRIFKCSMTTACRIKASGKIDAAIKQIGRKIIIDSELAIELAGRKTGGRK